MKRRYYYYRISLVVQWLDAIFCFIISLNVSTVEGSSRDYWNWGDPRMALLHRSFHFKLSFKVIYHSAEVIRTAAPPAFLQNQAWRNEYLLIHSKESVACDSQRLFQCSLFFCFFFLPLFALSWSLTSSLLNFKICATPVAGTFLYDP